LRSSQIDLHLRSKTEEEARRFAEICNACRYCEGYCSVFPALELRRQFTSVDLSYLANLCHDCRGCYYSCPYAPPHEFALNLPRAFAELRLETYERYAWPRPLAALFRRNGLVAAILALACTLLFLLVKVPFHPGIPSEAAGSFYAVVPEAAMIAITGAAFLFAVLALSVSLFKFWRDTKNGSAVGASSFLVGLSDTLTLRNLGGGGHGCNNKDEEFSQARRYFHHSLFYGFLFCFVSTCSAAFYEHVLGRNPPFPLTSLPVLLGTVGGVAMLIGIAGLVQIKISADPAPTSKLLVDIDYCFLGSLFAATATGLLLLALRGTGAMSIILALHLGVIVAVFLMLPYCKFVHGLYRAAALVRSAAERRRRTAGAVRAKEAVGG
jgi:citrate/tricarballylate utilization protein